MDVLLSTLQALLGSLPSDRKLAVAYSGGLDSTCLLHAAATLTGGTNRRLRALHINHGLQQSAADWQRHCQQQCAALGVEFVAEQVRLPTDASEDEARQARYEAFAALLGDESLLMAHHLDDQLETLLLRLMRGSGAAGLAGMPAQRELGRGEICRPWLGLERQQLVRYAESHGLHWVEDESNAGLDFDRNYCRNEILPRLEQRWPGYRESWRKSQTLLAESGELLGDLAHLDLASIAASSGGGIDLRALAELGGARQRNVLRHWLENLGIKSPGWHVLHQIVDELVAAREDASSAFDLGAVCLQRFRGCLFALRNDPLEQVATTPWHDPVRVRLTLAGNGSLSAQTVTGSGLLAECGRELSVRYRQGGEVIRLPGRPEKSLKKLFQELQVPPWLRERTPLLYQRDRLVCVPGVGIAADCAATGGDSGLQIDWQQPELVVSAAV